MFLPVDRPRVVPVAKVEFLQRDDEVFGLVLEGQARAYDVRALCYHHVVNDVIDSTPVAVTY